MKLNLSADELLTSTRSVRKRLDLERPVERALVEECLEIALQAPTGSNRQGWHWVIVEDKAKMRPIAELYRRNYFAYRDLPGPDYKEGDSRGERMAKVSASATYLAEHLEEVPLWLIPCVWGRYENVSTAEAAGAWGSLLPAVWSFMLALRERGLGSAWTTLHLPGDGEEKAAEVLGIPFAKATQAGLFPIAYTIGTDFKPAKREPLAKVLHWDAW